MKSQGIDCSDALEITHSLDQGISVYAKCDLEEGDVVATIPKDSCLTVKTSGAKDIIEEYGFEGPLGLSFALMYEISLGHASPWAPYLHLLPNSESLPLVWSLDEVDSLLSGTEIHKVRFVESFVLLVVILMLDSDVGLWQIVKEDKALIYDDWKENILPLMDSTSLKLSPDFFGVEQYIAAKSLVASRSFEVDDYHGFGMVPLADLRMTSNLLDNCCPREVSFKNPLLHDIQMRFSPQTFLCSLVLDKLGGLMEDATWQGKTIGFLFCFNHKTGAENVHFTTELSHGDSDNDTDNNDEGNNMSDNKPLPQNSFDDGNLEDPSYLGNDSMILETIIVKSVKAGDEVFNTYGSMGNAGLLHRYGFTEPDNPNDIVNIDLELVLHWSSALFSGRHSRGRLSLWRRLDYHGCVSQNSEYFEISSNGEPEIELLILLYIMLLPEEAYNKLDLIVSTAGNLNEMVISLERGMIPFGKTSEISKELLLTKSVCDALLALADARESLYGSNSVDDIDALRSCCISDQKLYHSLMLRVSERMILKKLRTYAATAAARSHPTAKGTLSRKKLKRT
ncbi:hypothetical protein CK203_002306 [Vitis vinifera]|uniref:N-lysine methyltransferase n=1 Tax=Vitis vinifera TaxID=29760 RepID=A0A438KIN3_VITVI|nr:hypothetical protein CK203_002306 [Vitis vinifera]